MQLQSIRDEKVNVHQIKVGQAAIQDVPVA